MIIKVNIVLQINAFQKGYIMNSIASHIKNFFKISLLTISFFALEPMYCSTQSPDDPTWPQESTDEYIYSIDTQIFHANQYLDDLFLESEITIFHHYFNSGYTRIKISLEIQNNGCVQKTTEIWTTKNPTYFTWKNGAFIAGIIAASRLIYFNHNTIVDWWNPKAVNNPTVPAISAISETLPTPIIAPEQAKSKEESITPPDRAADNPVENINPVIKQDQPIPNENKQNAQEACPPAVENGDPIIERTSISEALRYFFRGVDSPEDSSVHPIPAEETLVIEKTFTETETITSSHEKLDENSDPIIERTSTLDALLYFFRGLNSPEDNAPTDADTAEK